MTHHSTPFCPHLIPFYYTIIIGDDKLCDHAHLFISILERKKKWVECGRNSHKGQTIDLVLKSDSNSPGRKQGKFYTDFMHGWVTTLHDT